MSEHTLGPLTVTISDSRPCYIVTTDASGVVRFSTPFPCHSSSDKSALDTIECRHFKADEREQYAAINRRALADEVLRAASPDLLVALKAVISVADRKTAEFDLARAAITKATGAAA
jgi:hypothetical protein